MKLSDIEKGKKVRVVSIEVRAGLESVAQRMKEMGILEGAEVQIVHEAPVSRDPVAVSVRGALVALRRSEAELVEVQVGENT